MYKLIIVTYALTLAISLLAIEGYEIVIAAVNYIVFFVLCALQKSRENDDDRHAALSAPARPVKEERHFAAMSH